MTSCAGSIPAASTLGSTRPGDDSDFVIWVLVLGGAAKIATEDPPEFSQLRADVYRVIERERAEVDEPSAEPGTPAWLPRRA